MDSGRFLIFLGYTAAASPLVAALLGASLLWVLLIPAIGFVLVFITMGVMSLDDLPGPPLTPEQQAEEADMQRVRGWLDEGDRLKRRLWMLHVGEDDELAARLRNELYELQARIEGALDLLMNRHALR